MKCEACKRQVENAVLVCDECILSPAPVRRELGELKEMTEHHCTVMTSGLTAIEKAFVTASVPDEIYEKTIDLIRTLAMMNYTLIRFVAIGITEPERKDPNQTTMFAKPEE